MHKRVKHALTAVVLAALAGMAVTGAVALADGRGQASDHAQEWLASALDDFPWGRDASGRHSGKHDRHADRRAGKRMDKRTDAARRRAAWGSMPAAYKAECGSCHLAFEPRFLPAASWSRIMQGLEKHYGEDASLDAATVATLHTWLHTYAGGRRSDATPPPDDRITRSRWFVHKHEEDVSPDILKRPSIRSAANCAACHPHAEDGDFDDDTVRIPRS